MLPPWIAALMAEEEARRLKYQGQPGETQGISPGDAYIAGHLKGYGQVDAPSPWGYNRDQFNAEHPGYQGGYYNPGTGFYDAPTEVPFTAPGPHGPELIGTGGPPMPMGHPSMPGAGGPSPEPSYPINPNFFSHEQGMAGLPTGGDTSTPQDYGVYSAESSGAMPGADHQPDEAPPTPSWSDFVSTYQENSQTSNGT